MKPQFKLLASIIIFASTLLSAIKISAQCYIGPFGAYARYELQTDATYPFLDFTIAHTTGCPLTAGDPWLPGIGVNKAAPDYMLDILCDPSHTTNNDVNISTTATRQTVGYMIGGNQMLFTLGDPQSVFVGGQLTAPPYAVTGNGNNTFVGFNTYANLTIGTGNTVTGSQAGTAMVDAADETFYGWQAGYMDADGQFNTFIGAKAGLSTVGTAGGGPGDWNTFTGYECGYNNPPYP